MTTPVAARRQSEASRRAVGPEVRWLSAEPLRRHVAEQRRRGVTTANVIASDGVTVRTLQRALLRDRLRADSADRLAVALGMHPSELWPEWFDAGGVR